MNQSVRCQTSRPVGRYRGIEGMLKGGSTVPFVQLLLVAR